MRDKKEECCTMVRGLRKGPPDEQHKCTRRWSWAIITKWGGVEVETHHCVQHMRQVTRIFKDHNIEHTTICRGYSK